MPPMLCENHRKIGTFYKEWYLFTLTKKNLKIAQIISETWLRLRSNHRLCVHAL